MKETKNISSTHAIFEAKTKCDAIESGITSNI